MGCPCTTLLTHSMKGGVIGLNVASCSHFLHMLLDPWIESGLEFTNCEITIIQELIRLKQSPKPPIIFKIIQKLEIIHQNFEFCNCLIKLLISTYPSQVWFF
jgi:hypothetical protein